jgi:hypothetical protein
MGPTAHSAKGRKSIVADARNIRIVTKGDAEMPEGATTRVELQTKTSSLCSDGISPNHQCHSILAADSGASAPGSKCDNHEEFIDKGDESSIGQPTEIPNIPASLRAMRIYADISNFFNPTGVPTTLWGGNNSTLSSSRDCIPSVSSPLAPAVISILPAPRRLVSHQSRSLQFESSKYYSE